MTRSEARAAIVAAVEAATGAPGDSWSSGGVADAVLDALLDQGNTTRTTVDGGGFICRRTVTVNDDWKDTTDV